MRCVFPRVCNIILFFLMAANTTFGRQVEGRPTLPSDCEPGEHWVADHSKAAGSWTSFCRANRSGTSIPKSHKFWGPKFQSGEPKEWPIKEERIKNWKSREVIDVLSVLDQIPQVLWDTGIRGIHRMSRSQSHPNPATTVDGSIVLYDPAFQDEQYLAKILTHELAHEKYGLFSRSERADYARAAGWRVKRTKKGDTFNAPKCCFVQPDGVTSPDEDFANNLEYYLFDPKSLKKTNPGAYKWIEKKFGRNFRFGASK